MALTLYDQTIGQIMWQHLNSWPEKPNIFQFDTMSRSGKEDCGISLFQLAGSKIEQKYVNGAFIARWPFSIGIRTSGQETFDRIWATSCLNEVFNWLSNTPLPEFPESLDIHPTEFTQELLPHLSAGYESQDEEYTSTFTMRYTSRQ